MGRIVVIGAVVIGAGYVFPLSLWCLRSSVVIGAVVIGAGYVFSFSLWCLRSSAFVRPNFHRAHLFQVLPKRIVSSG